ncbi:hypothetical protein SDC9_107538 [bioreactor metagenome]|uniref:Uncharacterized protein n=1 Tax=bioreactor metagenome TaxID=1076179 RepID=A0A645B6K5_9ZZZZ
MKVFGRQVNIKLEFKSLTEIMLDLLWNRRLMLGNLER